MDATLDKKDKEKFKKLLNEAFKETKNLYSLEDSNAIFKEAMNIIEKEFNSMIKFSSNNKEVYESIIYNYASSEKGFDYITRNPIYVVNRLDESISLYKYLSDIWKNLAIKLMIKEEEK